MAAADDREIIETDVVIVGAGPAGLSAAIRLKQKTPELSVTVVEKAAEIGGHILSGAVMDPVGLDALLPGWRDQSPPPVQPVTRDTFHYLTATADVALPNFMLPPQMKRHGAVIVSLGELCRWLADKAQALGVDIFPMTAAVDVLTGDDGAVQGIITGDLGRARDGSEKPGFARGVGIRAKHTLIGEGARGSLAKQLIRTFKLDAGRSPQKYGLGIKEIWEIPDSVHEPGRVDHYLGFPLDSRTSGGGFAYHAAGGRLYLGFVTHLDYQNPTLSPFGEFQRFKAHPAIAPLIAGGKRLSYGARAMTSGGSQSIPEIAFPGGALIGCSAGYMNVPALKGIHNAIRSGIAAADAIVAGSAFGVAGEITAELQSVRNVKPLWALGGSRFGVVLAGIDLWSNALLRWSPFGTLPHRAPDYAKLKPQAAMPALSYAPAESRTAAVFLANLAHDEDQPVHLRLTDPAIPIRENLPRYGEPARLYCPAAVYEVDTTSGAPVFRINAGNCVHCKTCDIKDPAQNITWVPPEGGSGPNYSGM